MLFVNVTFAVELKRKAVEFSSHNFFNVIPF